MSSDKLLPTHFAVINPFGRDAEITYPHGPTNPSHPIHPPVNYHAYAACMSGGWYRNPKNIPNNTTSVFVLLRKHGLHDALSTIQFLQRHGKKCWICLKESGLHQVVEILDHPRRRLLLEQICNQAEGFIASTPETVAIYQSLGAKQGAFIPTPYPLEFPEWNLSTPISLREGLFIGTREFDVPTRHHLAAILTACEVAKHHQTFVTALSMSRKDQRRLESLNRHSNLRVVSGPLPYTDYIRLMSKHQLVFQYDASYVPGQVAGDALLARIPCIGGNGAIDRLTRLPFAEGELPETTLNRALSHPEVLKEGFDQVWALAIHSLSYSVVADQIKKLCFP